LSANAYVSNSVGTVTHAYIAAQSGGGTGTAWVPMTYVGNGAGPAPNTQVTQSVRLYADPGSNVTVCMERSLDINGNITGSIFYQISFSGSLVDVP